MYARVEDHPFPDNNYFLRCFFEVMKPKPRITISEWADKYRQLSSESSAEPGQWKTDRAPYQREIMDTITDPKIDTIIVMSSAQVGKSEVLLNALGYYIDQDPGPILMVQPTLESARDFSINRIKPMVRDTPQLDKIFDNDFGKKRRADNLIRELTFSGGRLAMVGANSGAGLSSKPIKIVMLDEVDKYEETKEGDAIELARKRTKTFHNRKTLMTSTPGIKGMSAIEDWYDMSDQRRYFVPCPKCETFQVLKWAQVKWDKSDTGEHLPETARYVCKSCEHEISNNQRIAMVRKGQWRSTGEGKKGIAGFHLNELYSPWSSFEVMAFDFIAAKENIVKLRTFINLSLGETWEDQSVQFDENEFLKRREVYCPIDTDDSVNTDPEEKEPFEVPAGGLILTAGVDIQHDRIECEITAWGPGEESWSIDYFILPGDPSKLTFFDEFFARLMVPYRHESGINMFVVCTCIDSGDGNFTDNVYKFVQGKDVFRMYAIKGSKDVGKPIISRPSKNNRLRIPLWTIGTDTAKELIYARLAIEKPGPGYSHFPKIEAHPEKYDKEYFLQLTAERPVKKKDKNGRMKRVWVKRRPRNEALDNRVYSLAALNILGINWKMFAAGKPMAGRNVRSDMPRQYRMKKKRRIVNRGLR